MSEHHPEDKCQKCGNRNVVWFADPAMWNKYHGDWSILCPQCFAEACESSGAHVTGWLFTPEDVPLVEQTLRERDDAEAAISKAYELVTGRQAEWSNLFGYEQALEEISEALTPPPSKSETVTQNNPP